MASMLGPDFIMFSCSTRSLVSIIGCSLLRGTGVSLPVDIVSVHVGPHNVRTVVFTCTTTLDVEFLASEASLFLDLTAFYTANVSLTY